MSTLSLRRVASLYINEWSDITDGDVVGDGGLDASDSEDSIGSRSGTRKECCEQENQDLRREGGSSARWISKNRGFCERLIVAGLLGGVGEMPRIRAFLALTALLSGVASVLSEGSSAGVASPVLRDLCAVSISCGANFLGLGGCLRLPLAVVSSGSGLNFLGEVFSSHSSANLRRLLLVVAVVSTGSGAKRRTFFCVVSIGSGTNLRFVECVVSIG